ncbi:putative RAD51C [Daphnia pulex]|uniref:DNA repair protein RAD51 homolog 3 n=1 Tax=Daphnia pulex TaxID=6669 RepID=E9GGD0_DAPPU|nr:putative RAD51C [Daphnia pulex]|eukprot:EFX81518.1 putative RAD51C [Daphnia pulex]
MATNNANSRPISTYPIPASIQTKLNKAGFLTTGSVLNLRPSELSSSAEISVEDAADVLDLVGKSMGKFLDTKTALEILREEQLLQPIVTLICNCVLLFKYQKNVEEYRVKPSSLILKEALMLLDLKVKLIVIDSLAFHFRHDLENTALRSRVLHKIAAELSRMAVDFGTAVVVTNQMTTKFDSKGQGRLTPALGTSWGHAPTLRLILDWDPSRSFRWATLIKSSSLPSGSAPYQERTVKQ